MEANVRSRSRSPRRPLAKKVPRAVRERQMLEAATAVFARRGYHDASMDEIAERAGISKPMLYAYFESKQGLCQASIRRARRRLFEAINAAADVEAAPDQQLWLGVTAFLAFVEEEGDSWALLRGDALGPFAKEVIAVRQEVSRGVAPLLRDAAAAAGAGEAALISTEPLARALVGAGESLARWWQENPGVPRDTVALLLMNFAWMGFGDLVRGEVWRRSTEA
jgi:AcrR family transcriptional regulator